MAYTAPTTRATGYLVTASDWNTDLVDSIKEIWKGTTAGDMDYYTAATTKSRLALGTSGYSLFSGATAPAWAGGLKVLEHDTSSAVVATSDDGNILYSFTLPAGTLGENGALYIEGNIRFLNSSSDGLSPKYWLTFGSSDTSDGVIVGSTTDQITNTNTADTYFRAALIAKGASSERLISYNISTTGAKVGYSSAVLTVDQSAEKNIQILRDTTELATSDSSTITIYNLMIYQVPYV